MWFHPQPDVPPYSLHHTETHAAERIIDSNSGNFVFHGPFYWLQPRYDLLIPLQVPHHLFTARRQPVAPVLTGVDYAYHAHDEAFHFAFRGSNRGPIHVFFESKNIT